MMLEHGPKALFNHVASALSMLKPAYLHVVEITMAGEVPNNCDMCRIRERFKGIYIANGGYNKQSGNAVITDGAADLVAFGVPFLVNPDLPGRFRLDAPLNKADQASFYGGDAHGYTDYPAQETT